MQKNISNQTDPHKYLRDIFSDERTAYYLLLGGQGTGFYRLYAKASQSFINVDDEARKICSAHRVENLMHNIRELSKQLGFRKVLPVKQIRRTRHSDFKVVTPKIPAQTCV